MTYQRFSEDPSNPPRELPTKGQHKLFGVAQA